jgi:hypothetical protein
MKSIFHFYPPHSRRLPYSFVIAQHIVSQSNLDVREVPPIEATKTQLFIRGARKPIPFHFLQESQNLRQIHPSYKRCYSTCRINFIINSINTTSTRRICLGLVCLMHEIWECLKIRVKIFAKFTSILKDSNGLAFFLKPEAIFGQAPCYTHMSQ